MSQENLQPNNPDAVDIKSSVFTLRKENAPIYLQHLFTDYIFRRCTLEEIEKSHTLTEDAWPGMPESQGLDLRANNMINAPQCGAFNKTGDLVGYTRLLWGYTNTGKPQILSHMSAVINQLRNSGIGEALRWLSRQVALEFPISPVTELTITFDNLQGRNSHLNFNKIGVVCGFAGGKFKTNAYGTLTGEQHRGNPTDRYQGRWYLNSEWTIAHLQNRIVLPSLEDARQFPSIINYRPSNDINFGNLLPIPLSTNTKCDGQYISIPVPRNWDLLLKIDKDNNFKLANAWRQSTRDVIQNYHSRGYTTIGQVGDKNNGINLQIMALNFDPFNPPKELLASRFED